MSLPCVVSALHSWAEPAAGARLLESYFEPADRKYAHLWLDADADRVEWRYQFADLGLCFELSRRFSLEELCELGASTQDELERLVFDHYRPLTEGDAHLLSVFGPLEPNPPARSPRLEGLGRPEQSHEPSPGLECLDLLEGGHGGPRGALGAAQGPLERQIGLRRELRRVVVEEGAEAVEHAGLLAADAPSCALPPERVARDVLDLQALPHAAELLEQRARLAAGVHVEVPHPEQ